MDYSELVKVYKEIENTAKRLEKTRLIADLLEITSKEDMEHVVYLLQGTVFPPWDERKIGMSSRLIIKTLASTIGYPEQRIESLWAKSGDLGTVAEMLMKEKKQQSLVTASKLTVRKVFDNLQRLASLVGEGTVNKKVALVSELLHGAKPDEACFIVRTVIEDLRVGVGEGVLKDAITWAFLPKVKGIEYGRELKSNKVLKVNSLKDLNKLKDETVVEPSDEKLAREIYNHFASQVQEAYDLTTDFAIVAHEFKDKGYKGGFILKVGTPIKVMLFEKVSDIKEGFEVVGKPAAIEYKYDGFRIQAHFENNNLKLFTRRLEDVTKQFPDVIKLLKSHIKAKDYILDGEIIGLDPKNNQWLSFQNISQRIKRKYNIEEISKKVPVMVHFFDAIRINGQNLLNISFEERRKKMKAIISQEVNKIELAKQLITDNMKSAEVFYKESLSKGNEGIMMKNLQGIYKPGKRVGFGVKVKPVMETLDLAIVGAEWGEGKRTKWLSSFVLACIDGENFLEIGKVGTGIKEKSEGVTFEELTKLLRPFIIKDHGKEVQIKPDLVVEIEFEEIQKSPTYSSGYALRFPRVIRIRPDRNAEECSTLTQIKKFFMKQRGRKI
ncbi:ATP-dependent DNA ligase [Candidatus Woesearchaeota archaeon]|nr:ATP-dependent DNA ligase [Candidatus Woesearchaeota archaeon]